MDRIAAFQAQSGRVNVVNTLRNQQLGFNRIPVQRAWADCRVSQLKEAEMEVLDNVSDRGAMISTSMEFDPVEHRFLLCGGHGGDVCIMDFESPPRTDTNQPWVHTTYRAPRMQSHAGAVTACQFYPVDSGSFSTGGRDGTVRVWSAETLHVVDVSTQPHPVLGMHWGRAAHAGGLLAVALGPHAVRLLDPRTRHDLHHLRWPGRHVHAVRFGEPLRAPYLFAGAKSGELVVWDIRSPKTIVRSLCSPADTHVTRAAQRAHSSSVQAIRFTTDCRYMVSMARNRLLNVWDAQDLQLKRQVNLAYLPTEDQRVKMEVGSDGRQLFAFIGIGPDLVVANITPDTNRRPDPNENSKWRQLKQDKDEHPDDDIYDSGQTTSLKPQERSVRYNLRNLKTTAPASQSNVRVINAHLHVIMSLAYRPTHQHLVTSSADGRTQLWVPTMDDYVPDQMRKGLAALHEDDLSDDDW